MFVIVVFCFLIISIHGNFTIISKIPQTYIYSTANQFIIEIDQNVTQPPFEAFIHFYDARSNTSIDKIDVHLNTTNVTYSDKTFTFYLPDSIKLNTSVKFYITFDQGVLFSNSTLNSTARNDSDFWYLQVIDSETSTTLLEYTSMETASSMHYSDTSTIIMTTIITTNNSINPTTTTTTTTTTISSRGIIKGESPPTRSAQLGMGLGITFITVIIVGEIIFFKYCYNGSGRSGNYFI
ncbi:unnamed protein product [Rotaria sordida]|uniref:Uncharacterized protein n=1 Tax=Rotaria sordida TaxID=392033 RepID=A0A819KJM8_9BILA|nr:unnamed protein product [Rotaria sordida]CAF3945720.1 unnamed protein product [Rotaria sordida]